MEKDTFYIEYGLNLLWMLPENYIKEGISRAYVKAICNRAGYNIAVDESDFGIDLTVREVEERESGRIWTNGICLDIQIKSSTDCRESENELIYPLRNKNYNDLITITTKSATKKILVVFQLPTNNLNWINQDIDSLIIKKCAFWTYLGGRNLVEDNNSTTTIRIPKTNIFSVESLIRIMDCIKEGGDLNEL